MRGAKFGEAVRCKVWGCKNSSKINNIRLISWKVPAKNFELKSSSWKFRVRITNFEFELKISSWKFRVRVEKFEFELESLSSSRKVWVRIGKFELKISSSN